MRLSSSATPLYKLSGPFALIGFALALPFGAALGLVVAFALFVYLTGDFRLKTVDATDTGLRVRNFRKEIEIPYWQIAEVDPIRSLTRPRKIVVRLKYRCAFGAEIRFIPWFSVLPIAKHEALQLLRDRIQKI